MFAGEHVAGTELLIGPLFVVHGVTAFDLVFGLLAGNLLAVLTWTFITAPIAVKHRLTLYFQLEKIGGKYLIKVYNVANGSFGAALLCDDLCSATAIAVPLHFKMPALNDWLPPGPGLIITVILTVYVYLCCRRATRPCTICQYCSTWMVVLFAVFGISALPELGIHSLKNFWTVANQSIWPGHVSEAGSISPSGMSCFFHVRQYGVALGMGTFLFSDLRRNNLWICFCGRNVLWSLHGLDLCGASLCSSGSSQYCRYAITPDPRVGRCRLGRDNSGFRSRLDNGKSDPLPGGLAFQSLHSKWPVLK